MKHLAAALLALSAVAQDQPPRQITIPAGTWMKVRVDETVSTRSHRVGDYFSATLAQPLIVDGLVVARRGQSMEGRVSESVKAGRVKGESRLAVEMVEMALADGRQIPIHSQLVTSTAGGGEGRDAAGVATATGTGAAIGAAASGGKGAAIGAGAGAAAAIIGVLATRGPATTIDSESVLTFRTLEPVTIDLGKSAMAFEPVRQDDYEPRTVERRPRRDRGPVWGPWGYPPPGWGWGGWGGPGVVVVGGRGWGRRW